MWKAINNNNKKVFLCIQICLKSFNYYPKVDSKSKWLELEKIQHHKDYCIGNENEHFLIGSPLVK